MTPRPGHERVGQRIKLRSLQVVSAVANCGGMAKAADQLGITQPVVSKTIADLEHLLGVRLFDRSKRGVELTSYGRAVVECGIAVSDELQRGVQQLEFLADPTAGELRIGSSPLPSGGFVPAILDQLLRQHPRVHVEIVEAVGTLLVKNELPQRNVEFAIVSMANDIPDDMNAEVLFNDQYVVMVGAQSPWARRRKVSLADLVNEPWILPQFDHWLGRSVVKAFHERGLGPPHATVFTLSLVIHHQMLATGRFIAMLPISLHRFGFLNPQLKILPIEPLIPPSPVSIVTLKNRTLSPVANLFIEYARVVAKGMAEKQ